MGCTKDFFKKKHEWSILKDQLLENYLVPYLEKIKIFNNKIAIFDCFAGKGKFDDGSDGSPRIILKRIYASNAKDYTHAYLIEQKYSDSLKKNTVEYQGTYSLISDSFENNIGLINDICHGKNVFLYIDPYGIKSLNFNHFERFKNSNPKTIEMLLNFNTFGFLREGCRLLNIPESSCNDSEVDYEEDLTNSKENMNHIANGEYWQDLIKDYNNGENGLKKAEIIFTEQYIDELKKIFKYVINIPIKDKLTNIPKYRMIYGGNSPDGLFLMVDEMHKAWKIVLKTDQGGQGDLFDNSADYCISSSLKVFNYLIFENELSSIFTSRAEIDMKDFFIHVIEKAGITYSVADFRNQIHKLEDSGFLIVKRQKTVTDGGKQSKALDFEKQTIMLSRKPY